MEIRQDSNGNDVLVDGKFALIPAQMIINLEMKQDRGIKSMAFSCKMCLIDDSGVIDYSSGENSKMKRISIPTGYLSTFTTEEVTTVAIKMIRGGYGEAIENIVNPVVEVL